MVDRITSVPQNVINEIINNKVTKYQELLALGSDILANEEADADTKHIGTLIMELYLSHNLIVGQYEQVIDERDYLRAVVYELLSIDSINTLVGDNEFFRAALDYQTYIDEKQKEAQTNDDTNDHSQSA